MSIAVTWDNTEKTVILFGIEGYWTVEDLLAANYTGQQLESQVSHPVSYIIDVTHNESTPANILSVTRRLFEESSQKTELRVIVGANHFAHIFFHTFASIYGYIARKNPVQFTDTRDEARQIIAQHQQQLTSLPLDIADYPTIRYSSI